MSKKTVFDYMPHRRTDLHEHSDGSVTFNTVQDVEPILDENKRRQNEYGDKLSLGKRGEFHQVASIPHNIWEQWLQQTNGEIAKDSKLLAAYLNNPDHKYFKTSLTNV